MLTAITKSVTQSKLYQQELLPVRKLYGSAVRALRHNYHKTSFQVKESWEKVITPVPRRLEYISKESRQILKQTETKPRIFILAAGEASRWESKNLKQLVSIQGEPLLARTLRQMDNQAIVLTHQKKLRRYPYATPSHHRWTCETLLCSQPFWGEETIILLGDVYYSDQAIKTILRSKKPLMYFGSARQVEIFALKFKRSQQRKVSRHLRRAIYHATLGGRGKLWESYRSLLGVPLHKHYIGEHFRRINSCTDFDTVEEYDYFIDHQMPSKRNRLRSLTLPLA